MDEEWRKKFPWFPPDYVTINMLRERWLKKQEEEKLKHKQEQEALGETQNTEQDCENQPHVELEVCHRFENNGPGKIVGKDGGAMALIEEKGKGKEKMGWSGNGRTKNKKYYQRRYRKHRADRKKENAKGNMNETGKRQNPRPKEGIDVVEKKNEPKGKGVQITVKNKKVGITGFPSGESSGTRGIGKIMGGGMTAVLPKSGVRERSSPIPMAQDARKDGFRGGFRRKENDRDGGFRGKEHRVELKGLKDNNSLGKKMEDKVLQIDRKRDGRNWRNRRGKGNKFKQSGWKLNEAEMKPEDEILEIGNERGQMRRLHSGKGDKFKQRGAEMSGVKFNEVKLKPMDEISEIGNKRDHMKGLLSGTGSNDIKQKRFDGEALTAGTLVLENKVEDTVLADKSSHGEFRGYGNKRGNSREKFENLTIYHMKGSYLGSKVERKLGGNSQRVKFGRLEVDQIMKQRNCSMVWVKKEQSGAAGGEASSLGVPPDE